MNILIILVATLIFYLPILANPDLFVSRSNDLVEFFWPIYYFVKNHILTNHQIPFWNNMILSGTPLLPDPQSPIFYPLNVLFLFVPIDAGFLISAILHAFFGGIGAYLLSKELGANKTGSVLAAILYLSSPKFAGFLEAGHIGLINSVAWIPFVFYFTHLSIKKERFTHHLTTGLFLSLVFYSHTAIFIFCSILVFLLLLSQKKFVSIIVVFAATLGLTSYSLINQINWQKETSRYLLLNDKDVYPKWMGKKEFIKSLILPVFYGKNFIQSLDSEKWIALGIIPALTSFFGFLTLKRNQKIIIVLFSIGVILLTLNNSSPIYSFLLKQDWYVLFRVSTRLWPIVTLGVSILIALGLSKIRNKFHLILLGTLAIIETFYLSWTYLNKPVNIPKNLAPLQVYEFLNRDKDRFRVFCTTRCLSQKESAIYNLELMDGYSTLQQMNFVKHSWQLTNSYWDYYTLSIPPIGVYMSQSIQPEGKYLGVYNVKYVISPYALLDKDLKIVKKIDGFNIYLNIANQPRSNGIIEKYLPNYIRINTEGVNESNIYVADVYSFGWTAYLNGTKEREVLETPSAIRAIDIDPDTRYVELKYKP